MAEFIISEKCLDTIRRTAYQAGRAGKEVYTVRGADGGELIRCAECGNVREMPYLGGESLWCDVNMNEVGGRKMVAPDGYCSFTVRKGD